MPVHPKIFPADFRIVPAADVLLLRRMAHLGPRDGGCGPFKPRRKNL
jgi:hypothetical protein